MPPEGVLNPIDSSEVERGGSMRKDLKQRIRALLIYSGLRPDQQAWMEGVLNPNNGAM